mmetsp:Transcript_63022/g.155038  ORF Transcript_63022/g.155038 Transcript_63022/m.155038 type:complete len:104 (-) Transcript_63022:96-407(-)
MRLCSRMPRQWCLQTSQDTGARPPRTPRSRGPRRTGSSEGFSHASKTLRTNVLPGIHIRLGNLGGVGEEVDSVVGADSARVGEAGTRRHALLVICRRLLSEGS